MAEVVSSGRFVLGPDCQTLENNLASLCHAKFAIGCASGSDALLLALMAFDVGPGDEVILPSFTFFATGSAVWRLGAKPVFVDIEPTTFNLDPAAVARAVTSKTRAIIPVHLFGQPADMQAIQRIAREHRLAVIEDAAQAIGAAEGDRPVGQLGDVACFSFYPTKNLGGFGDGGMMTTSNEPLANRLRLLRQHGMEPRYYHQEVGINSRLDTLQAAVLNVKLPHLQQWTEQRQANAARYQQWFAASDLSTFVTTPVERPNVNHVWNQYTIRVHGGHRDALRKHLADRKIGSEIYYPIPLHMQECFQALRSETVPLPCTELAASEVLSLPVFPQLSVDEQRTVFTAIVDYFQQVPRRSLSSLSVPKSMTSQNVTTSS